MMINRSLVQQKTYRLIASRHPTVGIFDDLTSDPDELRAAFLLESFTNDRVASSRLNRLPDTEIISGANGSGATIVMAAFLHSDEDGGRFTDYRLGGWYASFELKTAIQETIYHHFRQLSLSDAGFPNRIQMRELQADISTELVDVRGWGSAHPELYHRTDYSASQAFANKLRWTHESRAENGIVFDSVRCASGTNICLFWPSQVSLPIVQGDHFEYQWNAKGELNVAKLTNIVI
jgi:hypothetical protein